MFIRIIYTTLTIIEILHDILHRFCTLFMLHVQVPLSCYCHFIMFVLNDSILNNLRHAMIFTNKLPVLVRYIYLYYIILFITLLYVITLIIGRLLKQSGPESELA